MDTKEDVILIDLFNKKIIFFILLNNSFILFFIK